MDKQRIAEMKEKLDEQKEILRIHREIVLGLEDNIGQLRTEICIAQLKLVGLGYKDKLLATSEFMSLPHISRRFCSPGDELTVNLIEECYVCTAGPINCSIGGIPLPIIYKMRAAYVASLLEDKS